MGEVGNMVPQIEAMLPKVDSMLTSLNNILSNPAINNTLNNLDDEQSWSLTFSDGSGYTWKGSVSVSVNEGSVDAVLEMTISVTPSTVPVWKQGA